MLHYVILFLFLVIIVAFSPNVISNVKYMYNDWLSNIDESVKANKCQFD